MKRYLFQWLFYSNALLCLCLLLTHPTAAQIVPDTTLPENSTITQQGNTSIIESGTRAGGNLFHSFQEFSVPTNTEAFFNNAPDIQNIFSRVTGRSLSNIDGLIRANGTANLFLLNPNGIIFGPNARLNIGGSFLATTASSFQFADGTFFSVIPAQTAPLLTISVPVGLQFNSLSLLANNESTPGRIVNQSRVTNSDGIPIGLQVRSGNTLALVGGEVVLEGGTLAGLGGRIELGSVAGNSLVSLTPTAQGFSLGYEGVPSFQDIQLSQQARVTGGDVRVRGRRLTLLDGSEILAVALASAPAELLVKTSESVELSGNSPDGQFYSSLLTGAIGTGDVGNATIETRRLILRDGASVTTLTRSDRPGGNIIINATDLVEMSGTLPNGQSPSGLLAATSAIGNAGNVTVNTGRLVVQGGAFAGSGTFGEGNAGTVSVNASESVELSGTTPDGSPSGLTALTGGAGNAGNITIETKRLIVRDGAGVLAGSVSEDDTGGDAGNININASDLVELSGISLIGLPSAVRVDTFGSGNGGRVTIQTGQFIVRDGAQVVASTFGTGRAGNVTVTASELVELNGTSPNEQLPIPSGLGAGSAGGGAAGQVRIDTRRLIVRDGAFVGAIALREGSGGNVTVNASESVELIGTSTSAIGEIPSDLVPVIGLVASLNAQSTSSIGAGTLRTGNAGEVTIRTGRLILRDGAEVSAGTLGEGSGGSVTVNASLVELSGISSDGQSPSTLRAETAGAGNAGNVTIEAERLIVRDGARVNVSGEGTGNPGNINVTANNVRLDNQGILTAASATGAGGNIELQGRNIQLRRLSQISAASAPGTAEGNVGINAETLVLLEGSQIRTAADAPNGGSNITISPFGGANVSVFQSPDSTISASGNVTVEGEVQPATPDVPEVEVVNAEGLIDQRCASDRQQSAFTVTGRGGLPLSPNEALSSEAFWEDLRLPVGREERGNRSEVYRPNALSQPTGSRDRVFSPRLSPFIEIVEAQGWIVNNKGEVVLTAATPTATPHQLNLGCSTLKKSALSAWPFWINGTANQFRTSIKATIGIS